MSIKENIDGNKIKDLEACYKYIGQCNKCFKYYGYDNEEDNGYCPICIPYGNSTRFLKNRHGDKLSKLLKRIKEEKEKIASKKNKEFIKKMNSYHSAVSHKIYKDKNKIVKKNIKTR